MLRHLTAALAATVVLASVPAVAGTAMSGAGSTAIYPVLSIWASKYQTKTGDTLNYQAIGSGGGIQQITNKTVDFGASDKPLKPEDLDKRGLMQFPMIVIAIVPVVNLPGIKPGELTIDGPTLADIYLGKITKWNDPAIQKLNPGVKLPDMAVVVVHRSDGSGTTFNFTNYLGKVSSEWASKVGDDTSVQWPVGIGGKGNAGVAANVQQTSGSIGYVEFAYAIQNHMTYMDMKNKDGKKVKPDLSTFSAAASHADYASGKDFYLILTNQPGPTSWPIMGSTWVLMRPDHPVAQNHSVLEFMDWALHNGQADAEKLDYVPIPDNVTKLIEAAWTKQLPGAWK